MIRGKKYSHPLLRVLRRMDFWGVEISMENQFTDGGEVLSLTCQTAFYTKKSPATNFY
jgi:hypothetical protein